MEKKVNLGVLFNQAMQGQFRVHKKNPPRKKWNNQSGFYRVQKIKCRHCKQGHTWLYRIRTSNGEHRITRTNLLRLKNDIEEMGFKWFITDEENAKKTAKETHLTLDTLR